MNLVRKEYWLLSALLITKIILQIWATGTGYELHRDEFLHLDQGHHLAWGYASVPPFTSWTSWIIAQLGNSVFWVKFFPALWGVLTILLVWKMAGLLGGSLLAKTLAGIAVVFSSLVRLNLLYQPNSFDILSWSALIFFLSAYFQKKTGSMAVLRRHRIRARLFEQIQYRYPGSCHRAGPAAYATTNHLS